MNLNFAEICISSSIIQALKSEYLVLNSISEQLHSIYLTNYFAETFGEPDSAKSRPKRKNKKAKCDRIDEEEECDLKPLLESFDETHLSQNNKNSDFPNKPLEEEEKRFILKDLDNEDEKSNPHDKANKIQTVEKNNPILEEINSQYKHSQSVRSDKSSLLCKMKQDKLSRQFPHQIINPYSPKIPNGRSTLLSEEFNNFKQQPKKLSESYVVKFQSQNFNAKLDKKDSSPHHMPSPHIPSETIPNFEHELPLLHPRQSFNLVNEPNEIVMKEGQKATAQSEQQATDNCQPEANYFFDSQKSSPSNRRRRPSSQSILKVSIKEIESDTKSKKMIKENPNSKDETYSTQDNNYAFSRVKTEKSQQRNTFDNASFHNENFDIDGDSSQSLKNHDQPTEILGYRAKSPIIMVEFKPEVSCSQDISQLSSQLEGDRDERYTGKTKLPKLKKLVKEKSGKEITKPGNSLQIGQSQSLRMGKWSDLPDRFSNNPNKNYHIQAKNNFYSSTSDTRDRNSQNNVNNSGRRTFQNPTTVTSKTLKRGFNPKDKESNQKKPIANPPVAKIKTPAPKKERTVVQIKKILTWNKESNDEDEDKDPKSTKPNEGIDEKIFLQNDIAIKQESNNSLPNSTIKPKEDSVTPSKLTAQPKKIIKLKASRWEQTSIHQNESESVDFSQNSEVNQIDSTRYMSNESKSANEPQGYSKSYNIQQHNIFNGEHQKKSLPLQKFPKGFFQRTDIQVTQFVDLSSSNHVMIANRNQRKLDVQFFQMIDTNIKSVIRDLETFSKKFESPRQIIRDRIHKIVHQTFNHPAIYVSEYGSFATTLLTPYSDLDLAIRGCFFDSREQCVEMLTIINENLQLFPFIKKVTPILTAAIPVLKIEADPSIFYEDTPTSSTSINVKVDIIVEQFEEYNSTSTAMRTTEFTRNCNRYYKTFYHNVLLMKFSLSCNALSNTYKGELIRRTQCIWTVSIVSGIY